MNVAEIEINLKSLGDEGFDPASFPFQFIECFDAPKATITKLRQGTMNKSKVDGEVLWPKKLYFQQAKEDDTAANLDAMSENPLVKSHSPRFLLTTDGREFSALDTKIDEIRHGDYSKLNDHFDFFLPLAGLERYEAVAENPADIKAAGRVAKLYDAILAANRDWIDPGHTHALNLFMTRLLFCMFAEDTGIFRSDLFVQSVNDCTHVGGSDVASYLQRVFDIMDVEPSVRGDEPDFVTNFPYVNGGLFRERTEVPKFTKLARRILLETARLDWAEINPDIFGSMIQAVVEPGMRGDLGMHYTSVPNIMKVLQPLFLIELEEEFEKSRDNVKKLEKLLHRMALIRVFDPACGSGNFLIIAYREMRKIEMRILTRLNEIKNAPELPFSRISLDQFYGIECADFACETAKLSLWIAEYQINKKFKDVFGDAPPVLPLKEGGQIVHDNACRVNWIDVCPDEKGIEIYIVGNPPYLGRAQQTKEQKADLSEVFSGISRKYKKLDYISCWMMKGALYIEKTGGKYAFVTTNSICQGEQVALLWPLIFARNLEISFAHQSFKWKNNASRNAGVTCVVVGVSLKQKKEKKLFSEGHCRNVNNINPYLIEGDDLIVYPIQNSKTHYPVMSFGNMARDDGELILSPEEKNILGRDWPASQKFIRRFYGSQEFIKGIERWCLWIEEDEIDEAYSIKPIHDRIQRVREFRLKSSAGSTVDFASRPHRFVQIQGYGSDAIIVPSISSEKRDYIIAGFISSNSIINNLAFAIYNPPPHILGIISSRLHATWIKNVCGQLETRIRYSNTLGYNTFPIPIFTNSQINQLESHAWEIIEAREVHSGKTNAWLYDPETMPKNLLNAHHALDDTLERIYVGRPFTDDIERLEHLFKRYVAMTKMEN